MPETHLRTGAGMAQQATVIPTSPSPIYAFSMEPERHRFRAMSPFQETELKPLREPTWEPAGTATGTGALMAAV